MSSIRPHDHLWKIRVELESRIVGTGGAPSERDREVAVELEPQHLDVVRLECAEIGFVAPFARRKVEVQSPVEHGHAGNLDRARGASLDADAATTAAALDQELL